MEDITGRRFGKLTVLSFDGTTRDNKQSWLVQCDCGVTKSVRKSNLFNGNAKSCGCLPKKPSTDITGRRYESLVVLSLVGHDENKREIWQCQCDCGEMTLAVRSNLVKGSTRSCGCLGKRPSASRKIAQGYEEMAGIKVEISFKQARGAWFLFDGKAHSVMNVEIDIFRRAIREAMAGQRMGSNMTPIFKQEEMDAMDRWYFLLYLQGIGRPIKIYASKQEAEEELLSQAAS